MTTSVSEMKKKEELPMKLLDDPKIPTARWNPQRPHHSHKPLHVADEVGLKPGRPYCTRRRHHHRHLNVAPTNFNPKNWERSPQNRGRSPPTDEGRDPSWLHGPKATETGDLRRRWWEATRDLIALPRVATDVTFRWYVLAIVHLTIYYMRSQSLYYSFFF
jgi:hypothetical protein